MKALFTPKSATKQSIIFLTLLSLIFWIYPEIGLGASLQTEGQQSALVFEIKNPTLISKNALSYQDILKNDTLAIKLKEYLEKHESPLAEYAEEIIKQPQWQRALAISYVESQMGKFCFNNNCSGIGVKPGHPSWRKYQTKLDWFIDLNNLLEKPIYKERFNTFAKMKGVYVQPGSQRWVNGAQSKYNELIALTQAAALPNNSSVLSASAGNIELAAITPK